MYNVECTCLYMVCPWLGERDPLTCWPSIAQGRNNKKHQEKKIPLKFLQASSIQARICPREPQNIRSTLYKYSIGHIYYNSWAEPHVFNILQHICCFPRPTPNKDITTGYTKNKNSSSWGKAPGKFVALEALSPKSRRWSGSAVSFLTAAGQMSTFFRGRRVFLHWRP